MCEEWLSVKVKCRMCGHEAVSVQPDDMIQGGECLKCGHHTYEIIEEGDQDEQGIM